MSAYNDSTGQLICRDSTTIIRFLKFQRQMKEIYGLLVSVSTQDGPFTKSVICALTALHTEISLFYTYHDEESVVVGKKQALLLINEVVGLLNHQKKRIVPQGESNIQIDQMLKRCLQIKNYIDFF